MPTGDGGGQGPTLGWLLGVLSAVGGWFVGLSALGDNSFFTHLATGRVILDTWHIPRSDPYSFTATGRGWVVQSWLASLLDAGLDRWGGLMAIVVLKAALAALLAVIAWALTRPAGSVVVRLGVVAALLVVGKAYWVERPLTIGLVLLGIALLACEGRLDARLLVPVMWVWVNVHGSFPLGLAAMALLAIGTRLDGRPATTEWRALRWAALGTLLGGINPLGPRLLLFPVELLGRMGQLREIREWQAPTFTGVGDRAFLVLVVLAVLALARKPSWRATLPFVVFVPAALLGARNVVVASIVVVPGIAAGLAGIGSLGPDIRRTVFRPAAAVVVAAAVVAALGFARSTDALDESGYPRRAVDFADAHGLLGAGHRVVAQDIVGNYLELLQGPTASVFVDDRLDMFPADVVDDYLVLLHGQPGWSEVLTRRGADVVIWDRDLPLAQLLAQSSRWRVTYSDASWIVAQPAS